LIVNAMLTIEGHICDKVAARNCTRSEKAEPGEVSTIDGKFMNLGAAQIRTRLLADRLSLTLHLDDLINYARAKGGIHSRSLCDRHNNVGSLYLLESLLLDRNLVSTDWNVRKNVRSVRSRCGAALLTSAYILRGNLRVGNRCARTVG